MLSGCHLERADRHRCGRSFFAPAHLLETHSTYSDNSSASRKHGGDPGGSGCWPRRSLLTHRTTLASDGAGGGRATRGAIGACSVGHRGESGRTRSFGDDERCDTRDGRGCTQRTASGEGPRIPRTGNEAGSADGLRCERTRRSRHFTGACSSEVLTATIGIPGSDVPAEHHSSVRGSHGAECVVWSLTSARFIERHRRVRPNRGARFGFARIGPDSLFGAGRRYVTECGWTITTAPET